MEEKNKTTLPVNVCRTILKTRTQLRAGPPACKQLARELEEQAILIADMAGKLAQHSGRKTITREDILFAVEVLSDE